MGCGAADESKPETKDLKQVDLSLLRLELHGQDPILFRGYGKLNHLFKQRVVDNEAFELIHYLEGDNQDMPAASSSLKELLGMHKGMGIST